MPGHRHAAARGPAGAAVPGRYWGCGRSGAAGAAARIVAAVHRAVLQIAQGWLIELRRLLQPVLLLELLDRMFGLRPHFAVDLALIEALSCRASWAWRILRVRPRRRCPCCHCSCCYSTGTACAAGHRPAIRAGAVHILIIEAERPRSCHRSCSGWNGRAAGMPHRVRRPRSSRRPIARKRSRPSQAPAPTSSTRDASSTFNLLWAPY